MYTISKYQIYIYINIYLIFGEGYTPKLKIKIFMNTIGLEKYRSVGANRYTCPQCGKRKCFTFGR